MPCWVTIEALVGCESLIEESFKSFKRVFWLMKMAMGCGAYIENSSHHHMHRYI